MSPSFLGPDGQTMITRRGIGCGLVAVFALGWLACGLGSQYRMNWLVGVGFVIMGLPCIIAIFSVWCCGAIHTNWGSYDRRRHPVRFYLEVAFFTLCIIAWIVVGVGGVVGVVKFVK